MPPLGLALLVLLALSWGANWPIMKIVLTEVPLWTFRGVCAAFGAAGLLALAGLAGQRVKVPSGQWLRLAVLALFNITGWNVLAVYGLTYLPAGRAAMLAFTMPLWSTLLGRLVLHEPITGRRALGLALGMAGLAILLGAETGDMQAAPLGGVFMIGAAISWAIGIVLMKRIPVDLPTTALTGWQMLMGCVPLLVGAWVLERGSVHAPSLWPAAGLVYNVLIGFVFGYWAWISIVRMVPVGISSLGTLAIPVVGVISGVVILGERPGWEEYAALGLIVAALGTILVPERPSAKAPP